MARGEQKVKRYTCADSHTVCNMEREMNFYRGLIFALLLSIIFWCSARLAWGEEPKPILMKVFTVDNQYASIEDQQTALKIALKIVRKATRRNIFYTIQHVPDEFTCVGLKCFPDRLKNHYRKYMNPNRLTLALVPPVVDELGDPWGGGSATHICKPVGGLGVAIIRNNFKGADRIFASAVTTAHEILHLLGGRHTDAASVLNSVYAKTDKVLPETKRQVRDCLRRKL